MAEEAHIRPDPNFRANVEAHGGENVSRCYQCLKCTSGCPLTFAMDYTPSQIMRMIQLGLENELLDSMTIWVCASCQTCTTRCPNDIDIAHVMDTLRQLSLESDCPATQSKIVKFHNAFLESVRRHGRAYELGMVGKYKLSTGDLTEGAKLGMQMFKKGKLKLRPETIEGKDEVRDMFDKDRDKQES